MRLRNRSEKSNQEPVNVAARVALWSGATALAATAIFLPYALTAPCAENISVEHCEQFQEQKPYIALGFGVLAITLAGIGGAVLAREHNRALAAETQPAEDGPGNEV